MLESEVLLPLGDRIMKYDDASWHYGADSFPQAQPEEHGGTHIALFLKWCFIQGWAGELHMSEEPEAVRQVIGGTMTGTEFFFQYCDGKLVDEDLSEEGSRFAEQYYGEDGLYFDDYTQHFGNLMYVAPERAHDFSKYSATLEDRLRSGVLTKQQLKKRPWWKPW